jgi:DNA-binding GntR family transcriptional regulator
MIHRVPLRDEVYKQILEAIHQGKPPAGSRVRDTDLAAGLGVSRTPVREALLRLTREGVLRTDMGRGFRVPPLDPGEIRETGQILGALESLALDSTSDFPPERLQRLAEIDRSLEQTRGDAVRCADLEDEWHRTLLEGCPNRRLLELIANLRQVLRRYLSAYLRDTTRIALSTLPHQKIADALRLQDRKAALTVFGKQWRRGIDELEGWATRSRTHTDTKVVAR